MTRADTKSPPKTERESEEQDAAYPALEIDYALYERLLAESDWSDEQKREFIDTLWSIVVQFVDLGFGIHPLQQAGAPVDIPEEFLPPDLADVIELDESSNEQSMSASDGFAPPPGRDST